MPKSYNTRYEKIKIKEFLRKYVDIPLVLGYCKNCRNYGKTYSCPDFDFNVKDFWENFKYLHVVGFIIELTEEENNRQFNQETFYDEMDKFYTAEKKKITDIQYEILKDNPNVIGLGGGRCQLCDECMKEFNKECIHKDKLLYSIESLGGKVSEITKDLLKIEIVWSKDFKYPKYLTSVIGFLSNEEKIDLNRIEKYMEEV